MAVSLEATVNFLLSWKYHDAVTSGGTIKDDNSFSVGKAFDGVTYSATKKWEDRRTLTPATGTDLLDLTALTDVFGNALSFTKVKALWVQNLGELVGSSYTVTAAEDLTVGAGAAASAWSYPFYSDANAVVKLLSGALMAIVGPDTGWTVDNANRILEVDHVGTTHDITYDILIVGD